MEIFDLPIALIALIVQVIVLIVFFYLAWNVSQIKKQNSKTSVKNLHNEARRLYFRGDKEDSYKAMYDILYYYMYQYEYDNREKATKMNLYVEELEKMGGNISEDIEKFIKENYK